MSLLLFAVSILPYSGIKRLTEPPVFNDTQTGSVSVISKLHLSTEAATRVAETGYPRKLSAYKTWGPCESESRPSQSLRQENIASYSAALPRSNCRRTPEFSSCFLLFSCQPHLNCEYQILRMMEKCFLVKAGSVHIKIKHPPRCTRQQTA